jgi:hypothetical protein
MTLVPEELWSVMVWISLRTMTEFRCAQFSNAEPRPSWAVQSFLRHRAVELDRLQLAIGEESDRTAVGRPEREDGIVGIRQRTGDRRHSREAGLDRYGSDEGHKM